MEEEDGTTTRKVVNEEGTTRLVEGIMIHSSKKGTNCLLEEGTTTQMEEDTDNSYPKTEFWAMRYVKRSCCVPSCCILLCLVTFTLSADRFLFIWTHLCYFRAFARILKWTKIVLDLLLNLPKPLLNV